MIVSSPERLIEPNGGCGVEDNVDFLLECGAGLVTHAKVVLHDVTTHQVHLVHEVRLCCPELVV